MFDQLGWEMVYGLILHPGPKSETPSVLQRTKFQQPVFHIQPHHHLSGPSFELHAAEISTVQSCVVEQPTRNGDAAVAVLLKIPEESCSG
jgi:hypothetical protein